MLNDVRIDELTDKRLDRIRECLPELTIRSVQGNQDGLTNDVLFINDQLVFRFPKNDTWARDLLANELRVIDLAHNYLDIRIPEIIYRAVDFMACRFISGCALKRNDILTLDDAGQEQIAIQLATYLKQLHGIPIEEVERQGIAQSDTNRSRQVWTRLFEDIQLELFPMMMPHARAWVISHFAPLIDEELSLSYEPHLVNGDTSPYHILFDSKARTITGIIDFGTCGIGDPAADFACIIYYYGESFLRRMSTFYPEIETTVDRARFWAGTLELQWALSGIRKIGAKWSWFTVHLGGARDVMPIGAAWK